MIDTNNKKIFLIIIFVLLLLSILINCWLTYQLLSATKAYQTKLLDTKVVAFTSMYVEKVLMASQDIDFDTRLELETAVRSLNDKDIFSQWQRFTTATAKDDASNQAKTLLDLLIKKISH